MLDQSINAEELDRVLKDSQITFPATVDEIKSEAMDAGAPVEVMTFFEAILPGTTFDSREELLSMAEQANSDSKSTKGDAGTASGTMADDIMDDGSF